MTNENIPKAIPRTIVKTVIVVVVNLDGDHDKSPDGGVLSAYVAKIIL